MLALTSPARVECHVDVSKLAAAFSRLRDWKRLYGSVSGWQTEIERDRLHNPLTQNTKFPPIRSNALNAAKFEMVWRTNG
jgi:hypothetical protein